MRDFAELRVAVDGNGLKVSDEIEYEGVVISITVPIQTENVRLLELQARIWERAAQVCSAWAAGIRRLPEFDPPQG